MASFQFPDIIRPHGHVFFLGCMLTVLSSSAKPIESNFVKNHNVVQFLENIQNIALKKATREIVISSEAKSVRAKHPEVHPSASTLLIYILCQLQIKRLTVIWNPFLFTVYPCLPSRRSMHSEDKKRAQEVFIVFIQTHHNFTAENVQSVYAQCKTASSQCRIKQFINFWDGNI